ncbi:MAG: hypothetical protein CMC14_02300 [Flavobacteriaceae bacterium]|nr:hypothetical protein [Flavobacteriaceae bacterium]
MKQAVNSKGTARNQIPAIYNRAKRAKFWRAGLRGVDLGCGYDRLSQHLHDRENVFCLGYDPEWKSADHNNHVYFQMFENSDFVTLSNVLNVIDSQAAREETLSLAKSFLKEGGTLLVTVYEGDKDGRSRETRDGWQEHRRLRDYLAEVRRVFPGAKTKGGMIVATKEAE